MASEFSIIDQYFRNIGVSCGISRLSIGDDAAVMSLPQGQQLVTSIDTLIAGVHFPDDTSATDIACKALAVNLSDLAAMGADPAWFLLSLTLPEMNQRWIAEFAAELNRMATEYRLELVGGDTCRGALSISIQINGLVPEGRYVTRSGAQVGDLILVSGSLGNAAMGLALSKKQIAVPGVLAQSCLGALNRPIPRLDLVPFLRQFAHAAIDLSDGLVGDLAHILAASGVGATIRQSQLPVNDWIKANAEFSYALTGGDDYQICCCVDAEAISAVEEWNRSRPDNQLSIIGEITESGYTLETNNQQIDLTGKRGYQHFD